jgi:multidrug resistance efflux pump
MNRRFAGALLLGGFMGLSSWLFLRGHTPTAPAAESETLPSSRPDSIAANGVVEGRRSEVALRPEITGVLERVLAREGQSVRQGELLAELRNESQKKQVALARAELAVARADLDRLRNGERAEKRKAVAAVERARHILLQQAESDWKRSQRLVRENSSSVEQYQNDFFKLQRVRAEWEQAAADHALIEAPPRVEDLAAAEARVAAAEARLGLAESDLAKTRILMPMDGHILQVYAEPGELAAPNSTHPLLILADLSQRRIRAFIDELDVARVRIGQTATVTADGYPGREFTGRVTVIVPRMGKRNPETDQPGEYKDVYYQEVLIALDASVDLPLNLRVQVRIHAGETISSARER